MSFAVRDLLTKWCSDGAESFLGCSPPPVSALPGQGQEHPRIQCASSPQHQLSLSVSVHPCSSSNEPAVGRGAGGEGAVLKAPGVLIGAHHSSSPPRNEPKLANIPKPVILHKSIFLHFYAQHRALLAWAVAMAFSSFHFLYLFLPSPYITNMYVCIDGTSPKSCLDIITYRVITRFCFKIYYKIRNSSCLYMILFVSCFTVMQ